MGKHSAEKRKLSASISEIFQARGPRKPGRHSDLEDDGSAAGILRSTKRMPKWAAIAVPTAAVASLAVSGIMLAPPDSGSTDRVVFSGEQQPRSGPADVQPVSAENAKADEARKAWDEAVKQAEGGKDAKPSAVGAKEVPKETPKSTSNRDAGDAGKSSRGGSDKRKKSEPGKNGEATGQGGTCKASYYWQGQKTANGEQFNTNDLTAAHKSLPFNSRVKVTNKANGKSVTVRINDRGPYISGRCLDLSKAAMETVGGTGSGVITVDWEVQ